jgi:sugar (pentulose or hexulose) kinase
MMAGGWTIVVDVGKTRSKATLWDEDGYCVAQRSRANQRVESGVSLTLDVAGIEQWLVTVLAQFAALGPVSAIVPVAHGAGVALIRRGCLQGPPLDYEWAGVGADRAAYDKQRDSFVCSGSPALPAGLNLGIQLHYLESLKSADFRTGLIVPWAQYWAWLLCGVAVSEVSSLGCHTDLWRPYQSGPSELAMRRGWADRLAPLTAAHTVLGTLQPEWVAATGLSAGVQVHCGLHDSNAALLEARNHPDVQGHDTTILSTGTWFVAMRSPLCTDQTLGKSLPETRDCLVNVDVAGAPVPSSRFMGGREIEILAGATASACQTGGAEDAQQVAVIHAIESGEMILPSGVAGVGPFPNAKRPKSAASKTLDLAQANLYVALLADVALDLIGSCDTLVVEGRFSAAPIFVKALASLRPTMKVLTCNDENGVARGALRLAKATRRANTALRQVSPFPVDIAEYRDRWREAAQRADRSVM